MAQHGAMTSPERLKQIQRLARQTRRAERDMVEVNLHNPNRALSLRLNALRARDLAWQNMTGAEKAEYLKFVVEMDKDLDDYNTGANSGDWTK